jgi:uncharacterized protein DUF6624
MRMKTVAVAVLAAGTLAGLRDELLAMMTADQEARERLIKSDFKDESALAAVTALDARHTSRLRQIIDAHGWPSTSLVGGDGAHAAWLLVQHADADPAFQRRCLDLMAKLPRTEVSAKDVAYLTDRVLLAEAKPQRFGTQFEKNAAGKWVPKRLEDPEHVDARRREVGLEPLADYARRMSERYDKK